MNLCFASCFTIKYLIRMIIMYNFSCAKQIREKFLESKHHRKELLFIHSVVLLGLIKGFTGIVNGIKDFIHLLIQN